MTKMMVYSISLAVLFLMSCGKQIHLDSKGAVSPYNGIQVRGTAQADPVQSDIIIHTRLQNSSAQGFILTGEAAMLISPEGNAVIPKEIDGPELLMPGETADYHFIFHPINSRYFHQMIGWNGDLEQSYTLTMDFIQDANSDRQQTNLLTFTMSDEQYQGYLENYSREAHIQLYTMETNQLPRLVELITHQVETLKEGSSNSHAGHGHDNHEKKAGTTIIISGRELYLDGLLFKVVLYREQDSYQVILKIQNRNPEELIIHSKEILLRTGQHIITPDTVTRDGTESGPDFIIRQNERLELSMSYKGKGTEEGLFLDLGGIRIMDRIVLIPEPIKYDKARHKIQDSR